MSVNRRKPRDRSAAIREGVMRHVVGATRRGASAKPAAVAAPAAVAEKAPPKPMKITDAVLARASQMSHALDRKKPRTTEPEEAFKAYQPKPGVLPKGVTTLAMDNALDTTAVGNWAFGGEFGPMFEEGIGFLGYAYLAQLTQRPEYRRISERIATEMTRKWIKLNVVSATPEEDGAPVDPAAGNAEMASDRAPGPPNGETDPVDDEETDSGEGPEVDGGNAAEKAQAEKDRVRDSIAKKTSAMKAKRIKELEDRLRELKVKDAFYNIAEGDGWFGRYHLYLDVLTQQGRRAPMPIEPDDTAGRAELKTSIGNGRNAASMMKVKKGFLKGVCCVEPMWCYPATYDAQYPTKANFYTPSSWYVNGVEHHVSRLLTFVGREVPDILKPAYAFGGLSMSQMAKPYVDNWLRTRQAVADLIESFSVSGIYTNMATTLQDGGDEALKRIELFNKMRSNAGSFALDKETEEFFNVSTPLGTLDALQAQSQEQMSSVSGIPLIILLGITPTGLNASSEGEIRAFYDWIHAFQESFFRDHLQTVIHFVMLDLWGEIDEEITFEFEPLWSMTDKEQAEIQKIEAETDQIRIDSGVLSPEEVRKALAAQPESRYADINPDDVPEPPEPPDMGGDKEPGDGDDEAGGAGGASEQPFGAHDEWTEGDHPRATDGKFGAGSGSSSTKSRSAKTTSSSTESSTSGAPLKMAALKKSGGKLGSNEGGVYTDDAGGKFYVKKPSTKAHVANEMAAARLYQLAGVNTLKYRDAGPDHVATEWSELDKNNISKFSAAEKKAAAGDFAVHAWLSNWDAAGLGGDNQGVLAGKPTTLDVGGSLRYRAQGGPKGAAFGNKVTELDTLRDKSMNPDAAGLFGSMSDAEIKSSIERVTKISDADIRKAVGDDAELADTLIARKQNMAKRFGAIAHDEALFQAALDSAIDDQGEELSGDAAMMAAALDAEETEDEDDLDERAGDDDREPEEVAPDVFVMAQDEFDESKHPRADDGKFGSGGGGGSSGEKKEDSSILDDLLLPGHPDHPDTKKGGAAKTFATKKEHIAHLLTEGTTPKDLMSAMGWPSVSMPAQAKSLGMKLEKKDGKYFGTKMSAEELKAAKEADQDKATQKAMAKHPVAETLPGSSAGQPKPAKSSLEKFMSGEGGTYPKFLGALSEAMQKGDTDTATNLMKYNPAFAEQLSANMKPAMKDQMVKMGLLAQKVPVPQATPDELKKAKKSTTVPISTTSPDGVNLIKSFNEKYAGKDGLSDEALNEKVQAYKDLQAGIQKADSAYAAKSKAEKLEADKKAIAEAEKKKAEKLAKEKADLAEKFAADPELEIHYDAMAKMFGGKDAGASYLTTAASKVKSAGLSKVISPEAAVPIIAYSGSHYVSVNEQLRAGKMTPAQYAFSKSLNTGLDKLPSFGETTYRKASLSPDQVALYEPGYVIEERGFMSTSKNKGTWSGSHDFTVHGKNGKDIQKLSSHHSEAEVLFKSGSKFEVVSKQGTHIVLKEV